MRDRWAPGSQPTDANVREHIASGQDHSLQHVALFAQSQQRDVVELVLQIKASEVQDCEIASTGIGHSDHSAIGDLPAASQLELRELGAGFAQRQQQLVGDCAAEGQIEPL